MFQEFLVKFMEICLWNGKKTSKIKSYLLFCFIENSSLRGEFSIHFHLNTLKDVVTIIFVMKLKRICVT